MPGRARIDRRAVVTRHHVVLHEVDPESPLSLGNGEFAFTADATGLQTFPELFEKTIPLGTQSQWGWHTFPNPEGWSIDRFQFAEFDSHGRKIGFAETGCGPIRIACIWAGSGCWSIGTMAGGSSPRTWRESSKRSSCGTGGW